MPDFNEWAKTLEAEIDSKQQKDNLAAMELVTRRKLINDFSPELWNELQKSFEAGCGAINARGKITLTYSLLGPDTFVVKRDGGTETLVASRNSNTQSVSISPGRKYIPAVMARGDGEVAFSCDNIMFSCEEIARESLGYFIKALRN